MHKHKKLLPAFQVWAFREMYQNSTVIFGTRQKIYCYFCPKSVRFFRHIQGFPALVSQLFFRYNNNVYRRSLCASKEILLWLNL